MATVEFKYLCERRGIKMISADGCKMRRARVKREPWRHLECVDCPGAVPLDPPVIVTVADPPSIPTEPAPTASTAASSGPLYPPFTRQAGEHTKRDGVGSHPREDEMRKQICKMPGCDQPTKRNAQGKSMGYCQAHWVEAVKHGKAHQKARAQAKIQGEVVPPLKEHRLDQHGATLGGIAQQQVERLECDDLDRDERESTIADLVDCLKSMGKQGCIPGWEAA
jgi:hypothetical protein